MTPDDLRLPLPPSYAILLGADTGTFMSAVLVAVSSDPYEALVLEEFPNYRYVSGELELLDLSVPEWARRAVERARRYLPDRARLAAWADPNTQFRAELAHYGLMLQPNPIGLVTRVEVAREYVQAGRVWLAPWLQVLPYELEIACWPDEANSAGRYERVKRQDHTLDAFEHVLSRRPRSRRLRAATAESFLDRMLREHGRPRLSVADTHLGPL